jgi:S1-C subfamily serine protease
MQCRGIAIIITILLTLSTASGCRTIRGAQHLPRQAFVFIMNTVVFQACVDEDCIDIADGSVMGSGFLVATNDRASWGITAGHLCVQEPPQGATLVGPDGVEREPRIRSQIRVIWLGGEWHHAVVEEVHPNLDLCVLRLDNVRAPQIIEVAPRPPRLGDRVFVMSAPLGTFDPKGMLLHFEGIYSGHTADIPPPMGGAPMIFDAYTVPARGGSSGSPIMNTEGQLVGVTSVALRNFEHMCLSPTYVGVAAVVRDVQERAHRRNTP